MNILELKNNNAITSTDPKLSSTYTQFEELLSELKKKELSPGIISAINKCVEEINSSPLTGVALRKLVKQKETALLKQIEKELKIVPKNYYRNLWLALGMSVFGLPLGVAFGAVMGNMAFFAIGLPIGMSIGIAVGMGLDKKACAEGKQLDIEIK